MATSAPASSRLQEAPKQPKRTTNLPVFTCRHRALKAAVWKNETENGVMFNTTVSRSYRDGEHWRQSDSFGYDDVLIIAELLRACHGFISHEMAKQTEEARE